MHLTISKDLDAGVLLYLVPCKLRPSPVMRERTLVKVVSKGRKLVTILIYFETYDVVVHFTGTG